MSASAEDIAARLVSRGLACGEMIHFGFKNNRFQLPTDAEPRVYPMRVSASGTNHLNLLVVSRDECVRLEPQRFASLTYRAGKLDARLERWSSARRLVYRLETGDDKTCRNCVAVCLSMLDRLIAEGAKNRD